MPCVYIGWSRSRKLRKNSEVYVVVIRYRLPIRPDLAEQQRLQEAPQGDGIMPIAHAPADLEGPQHVAFDIDMPRDIGVANPPFVHAGECPQGLAVAQGDGEARRPGTEASATTVRKDDLEGSSRLSESTQDSIDQPRRLFGRCCRNAWRVGSSSGRSLIIHVRSRMATVGLYNMALLICHRLLRDCSPLEAMICRLWVAASPAESLAGHLGGSRLLSTPICRRPTTRYMRPAASAFARIALAPAR